MKKQTITVKEIINNPQLLLNKIRYKNGIFYYYYKIDSLKIYYSAYEPCATDNIVFKKNRLGCFKIFEINWWFGRDTQTIDVI